MALKEGNSARGYWDRRLKRSVWTSITYLFNIFGVSPKIRPMGYVDAVEAIKNEPIVDLSKMAVPDSSILDIASARRIRIFSFSNSEVEKIIGNSVGLRKIVAPSDKYPVMGKFKTFEDE